ncbi:MAG: Hsp20/alpha crystallin family protein [Cyclobacteriaceae bacterium]
MNLTLRPTTGLSSLFSDWLRPDSFLDRDFFDLESGLFPAKLGVNVPSVNIKETPKEYTLEVAAPGLERKDFSIEVDNHMLKISAEKEEKKEDKEQESGYSRKEYSYNSFMRSFTLPENVKEADIDAKYEKGILVVHIPKVKETPTKPVKKIAVS